MMAELYEKASQWTPSWLKEPVRRRATLAACQIGKLPGVELLNTHLAALFERLGINCVLDVGAHVGQYGRFLRNIGYKGHIISFEPVLANFTTLERRRAGDQKWMAHRMALGSEDGTVAINVANITQFSSILAPNRYSLDQFGHCSEVNRTEAVALRRLDGIIEDCIRGIRDPRVFLKLDTQGYDLKVLEGAGGYLERVLGVQSELSVKPIYEGMTGYLEALRSMNDMGFELTGMFSVLRDAELRVVEFDSVMIRGRGSGAPR